MPGAVIDTETLFAPLVGRRGIGLAVSGGPDSLALMLLVARWRQFRPAAPPVYVYSVDHALRSEAAAEVAMVLAEAARLGLPARGLTWEGEKPRSGLMAAARAARYRLIREAMVADDADILVTAHHLSDQAETVLMRLAHGSGVEGLAGMAPLAEVEGVLVFRPLLAIERAALSEIVADAGLVPADDPSNRDLDYERVRWRALLPQLGRLGLDAARLGRFARRMAEIDDWIEIECSRAIAELARPALEGGCTLDRAGFEVLPPPVALRVLSRLLTSIGTGQKPHALGAVEILLARLTSDEEFRRTTLHGCLITRTRSVVRLSPETGRRRGKAPLDRGHLTPD